MINPRSNFLFDTDSYKVSMGKQFATDISGGMLYVTARKNPYGGGVVFMGLQALLREWAGQVIFPEDIELAEQFWTAHGEPFDKQLFLNILNNCGGRLPITIQAIPEGSEVPPGTAMVQVIVDQKEYLGILPWVETAVLRAIWYPSTIATNGLRVKRLLMQYTEDSGSVENIGFKLHDFGSRGTSSMESARLGGMAHLANFMGTDTAIAILAAAKYYDADIKATGFSIPASEHSTMTSWGRDREVEAMDNMINQFGSGVFAVVSDTYNIYDAVDVKYGQVLRDKIQAIGGKLIIRPDSGDPLIVLPKLLASLERNFTYKINDRGYKVFDKVGIIWGDGITYQTISSILRLVVTQLKYSIDNFAFGQGGALLQAVTRDDYSWAAKLCAVIKDDRQVVGVAKDPITDSGKKSFCGIPTPVIRDGVVTQYDALMESSLPDDKVLMGCVFQDGELYDQVNFQALRARMNRLAQSYDRVM